MGLARPMGITNVMVMLNKYMCLDSLSPSSLLALSSKSITLDTSNIMKMLTCCSFQCALHPPSVLPFLILYLLFLPFSFHRLQKS